MQGKEKTQNRNIVFQAPPSLSFFLSSPLPFTFY